MNKLPMIARLILGLIFFVFGLNGFFHFLPMPPMSGPAGTFMGGLDGTGVQVVSGILLLSGAFVLGLFCLSLMRNCKTDFSVSNERGPRSQVR